MIHILTRDHFLLCGIQAISDNVRTIPTTAYSFLKNTDFSTDTFIIDTLETGCFTQELINALLKVKTQKIIFLSAFKLCGLKSHSPFYFIHRTSNINDISALLNNKHRVMDSYLPAFRLKELEIARMLALSFDKKTITSTFYISERTLNNYKYNLMLILRIRKMYQLITHPIVRHLISTEDRMFLSG